MLESRRPWHAREQEHLTMDFGQAIAALKNGDYVQRAGWNGKNMHLYLEDGGVSTIGDGVYKGQERRTDPHICMYTAQGTHQPGWNASQADMLATDWQLVKTV